jgi:DNA-binding IclR family transcriptional regulator
MGIKTKPNPSKTSLLPKQPNRSLIEGMRVLQWIMNSPEPCRVVDIARELDLEMTRAHRLLRTFTALGFLQHTPGRRYVGGPAVPILASQAMHASGFIQKIAPVLQDLLKETRMLVAYGLLWERSVTYLFHARPGTRIEKAITGHNVLPATESRIGLTVLSRMDENEVRALYDEHDPKPFDSVGKLLTKLRGYRAQGFTYEQGFASKNVPATDEHSLAVAVPGNPHAAIALVGSIPPGDVSLRLDQMRAALERIASKTG